MLNQLIPRDPTATPCYGGLCPTCDGLIYHCGYGKYCWKSNGRCPKSFRENRWPNEIWPNSLTKALVDLTLTTKALPHGQCEFWKYYWKSNSQWPKSFLKNRWNGYIGQNVTKHVATATHSHVLHGTSVLTCVAIFMNAINNNENVVTQN